MPKVPTNAYRVFTDPDNVKQLAYISPDGMVVDLVPDDTVKALPDGYYTRQLKLIRTDPKPAWLKRQEAAQRR